MGVPIPLFGLGLASRSPFVTAKYNAEPVRRDSPSRREVDDGGVWDAGEILFLDLGATPPVAVLSSSLEALPTSSTAGSCGKSITQASRRTGALSSPLPAVYLDGAQRHAGNDR
jgi:hypothetical protein